MVFAEAADKLNANHHNMPAAYNGMSIMLTAAPLAALPKANYDYIINEKENESEAGGNDGTAIRHSDAAREPRCGDGVCAVQQNESKVFTPDQGFALGTMYKVLNKPFCGGRCGEGGD